MKKLISFILLLAIVTCSNVAISQNTLRGITVPIYFSQDVKSHEDIPISIQVLENVLDRSGNILIAKDAPIKVFQTLTKAKGLGKEGGIKIDIVSTIDVNGNIVPLEGSINNLGENKRSLSLGLGLGLGFLTVFLLPLLCIKGGNAIITKGTTMTNVIIK